MPAEEQSPIWSRHLPERGPGDLGPMQESDGPVFAFYMTAVRVEVDPRSEEVIEVIVDERTMERPAMVTRLDGSPIVGEDRGRVSDILSRSEWPTWDYGSVGDGPTAESRER